MKKKETHQQLTAAHSSKDSKRQIKNNLKWQIYSINKKNDKFAIVKNI